MRYTVYFIILAISLSACATKKIKDVNYSTMSDAELQPKLNIFIPRRPENSKPLSVLIFVHGGNWNTGNKDQYGFFGRNFAKKNMITVIPDYTLSPAANYDVQAVQIAAVIKWVKKNIEKYHGNTKQIFLTGHSAGGHLAALAVMNPKYGIKDGEVAGIILNDAAGLDMKHYLEENPPTSDHDYLTTWSNDPNLWRDASPIYFINEHTPPVLIYVGDKTYNSIKVANSRFSEMLKKVQPDFKLIRINKSHIPMILQYLFPWNDRFKEIKAFIGKTSKR